MLENTSLERALAIGRELLALDKAIDEGQIGFGNAAFRLVPRPDRSAYFDTPLFTKLSAHRETLRQELLALEWEAFKSLGNELAPEEGAPFATVVVPAKPLIDLEAIAKAYEGTGALVGPAFSGADDELSRVALGVLMGSPTYQLKAIPEYRSRISSVWIQGHEVHEISFFPTSS